MAASLSLSRVLALVGGLGLVAAFFMPWFASQGLLLSGQFLHTFLSSASPTDLRRFLPASSPAEVQALRLLVDLFPACGVVGGAAALAGGLVRQPALKLVANSLMGLSGVVALIAWAGGVRQLPPGATPEVGLWLIAASSLALLVGLVADLLVSRHAR
jgi:hypothetical protein